jgi:hypothetical protein
MRFYTLPLTLTIVAGLVTATATSPASAQSSTTQPIGVTAVPPPPAAAGLTFLEIWSGVAVSNKFAGTYFGAVRALNETQNLWTDGFLLRGEELIGRYHYTNTGVTAAILPEPHVDMSGGSLMFGYRKVIGESQLTGYFGPVYETHTNPDPAATIHGSQVGVKALVEDYTPFGKVAYFYGQAFYSSPFSTYNAYGQLAFKVMDKVWIGPEASYSQNQAPYREERVGAMLRFETGFGSVIVAGGYSNPLTASPSGYYANAALFFDFK